VSIVYSLFRVCGVRLSVFLFFREQSRSTSVHESDGGPAAEELARRKAMEYEEDDEAQPETVQLREASVSIPNFPVPTSSDNTVRLFEPLG
jgi:hypothetical protein